MKKMVNQFILQHHQLMIVTLKYLLSDLFRSNIRSSSTSQYMKFHIKMFSTNYCYDEDGNFITDHFVNLLLQQYPDMVPQLSWCDEYFPRPRKFNTGVTLLQRLM